MKILIVDNTDIIRAMTDLVDCMDADPPMIQPILLIENTRIPEPEPRMIFIDPMRDKKRFRRRGQRNYQTRRR